MSLYNVALALLGVAILGVAWLPSLLGKYPLSYPILYIALGVGVYLLPLAAFNGFLLLKWLEIRARHQL